MSLKRVYKYELPVRDLATIRAPLGVEWLAVGCQGESLFIWGLVDPTEESTSEKTFRVAGTGHNLNLREYRRFIGTAFMHNAALVWHVFEVTHD
jgi:hypothetical protein